MAVSWWLIAGVGVALVVVALIVIAVRRRPGTLALRITWIGAVLYSASTAVATAWIVIATLVSDAVEVSLPVRTFWPDLLPSVEITDGPPAEVVAGGFERAEVTVAGLETGTRVLLASGHLVQGATFTLIGVVVALLAHRLLKGDPFRRILTRAVGAAAATIGIGGIGWQLCFGFGGWQASIQALSVTGWTANSDIITDPGAGVGWPQPPYGLAIEFWPIFLALALAAIAAAFRSAERLQRDTEGLV